MQLTHPNKILYPHENVTKKDVADYLLSVSDLMLPYVNKRLLSVVRCPSGYDKKCFYQKHMAQAKKYLGYLRIENTPGEQKYFYIKDAAGLLYLAQMNVLEIHPWGSKINNLTKPDILLFDLDPSPSVKWRTLIEIAHFMRTELAKLNLISFVKTTGGKGLHITIPIKPEYSWDEVKLFAHRFAVYIVKLRPDVCTVTISKSKRRGKILIDYLRNGYGSTAVAPYSLRAKKGAPIATPIDWSELTTKIRSDSYHIKNIQKRLNQLDQNPWKDFYKLKQKLDFKKLLMIMNDEFF